MYPRLSVCWTTRGEKVNDCTKSKMVWTGSHQCVITGNNWTFNPSSNRISFSPIWKIFHFRVGNIFLILISNGSATQDAFFPYHRPNISAQDHLIKCTVIIVWSILPESDGHSMGQSNRGLEKWCHDDEMSYQWLYQLSWNSSYSKTPWNIIKIISQNIWFHSFCNYYFYIFDTSKVKWFFKKKIKFLLLSNYKWNSFHLFRDQDSRIFPSW